MTATVCHRPVAAATAQPADEERRAGDLGGRRCPADRRRSGAAASSGAGGRRRRRGRRSTGRCRWRRGRRRRRRAASLPSSGQSSSTPAAPGAANTRRFFVHCSGRAVRTSAAAVDEPDGRRLTALVVEHVVDDHRAPRARQAAVGRSSLATTHQRYLPTHTRWSASASIASSPGESPYAHSVTLPRPPKRWSSQRWRRTTLAAPRQFPPSSAPGTAPVVADGQLGADRRRRHRGARRAGAGRRRRTPTRATTWWPSRRWSSEHLDDVGPQPRRRARRRRTPRRRRRPRRAAARRTTAAVASSLRRSRSRRARAGDEPATRRPSPAARPGGAGDAAQERHDAVAGRQRPVDVEGGDESTSPRWPGARLACWPSGTTICHDP